MYCIAFIRSDQASIRGAMLLVATNCEIRSKKGYIKLMAMDNVESLQDGDKTTYMHRDLSIWKDHFLSHEIIIIIINIVGIGYINFVSLFQPVLHIKFKQKR